VCLRLEDKSVFVGEAEVRLMPNEGYEVIGAPTGTEGETLFSGLEAGKYSVEASAPGYLTVRQSTQIEAGHVQRTMYVLMKPRPTAKKVEKTPEKTLAEAAVVPAVPDAVVAAAKPARNGKPDVWTDRGLEINVPPVDPSVECPTAQVLKGVGDRMTEFVSNLERFTATEDLVHYTMEGENEQKIPEKRRFAYVVSIVQNQGGIFALEEYRDGAMNFSQFPASVATFGLPALDLIFHPMLAPDFNFKCEGLGQTGGKAAWQVHFEQKIDRPVKIRYYSVAMKSYPVYLEGRIWADPGTFQVLRLESELEKPIPEIGLTREHTTINYAAVEFQTQKVQIWLPQEAEIYVERKGRRYHRRHTYTDFKVFNVDTAQNIQAPESSYSFINGSEREIAGVLTVFTERGGKQESVAVNIIVPAGGKVFKSVGPGKDVNMTASAVTAAKFVHNGKAESVKVEANLGKETTLDVIADTIKEP